MTYIQGLPAARRSGDHGFIENSKTSTYSSILSDLTASITMSAYPQIPPEVVAALAKEDRSPLIIGIVAGFTGVAFACVLLRFYSRAKLVGLLGPEDYFIAISMVSSLTCISTSELYLHHPLGLLDM
jgi:hypothetical protein